MATWKTVVEALPFCEGHVHMVPRRILVAAYVSESVHLTRTIWECMLERAVLEEKLDTGHVQ